MRAALMRLRFGPDAPAHAGDHGNGNGNGSAPPEVSPMDPLLAAGAAADTDVVVEDVEPAEAEASGDEPKWADDDDQEAVPTWVGYAAATEVDGDEHDAEAEYEPEEAPETVEPVGLATPGTVPEPLAAPVVPAAAAAAAAGLAVSTAPASGGVPVRRQRVRPTMPLLRRRPRVRKVTRIVRRIDAWSVFKISLVFYIVLFIILLVAGVLLWNLANTTGTVANVEGFIRDLFGLKTFTFDGAKMFRAAWVLGAILVVAGTGLNVTLAVLFNLISDLVGGVRVAVLEEEVILRERPVARAPVAPVPAAEPEAVPPTESGVAEAPEAVDGDEPVPTSVEEPTPRGL
jgi:hypothetical protein